MLTEPEGHDWVYYRIYVDSYQRTQTVLEQALAPVVTGRGDGAACEHWFFLRFLDLTGLHVRARFQAAEPVLAAVETSLTRRLTSLFDGPLNRPARDRLPHVPDQRGFSRHIYDPEYGKWGGTPGVRLAESVFTASSAFAVSLAGDSYWPARYPLALACTAAAIGLLPEQERTAFLHQYSWYWTGGPGPDASARRAQARLQASQVQERFARAAEGILGGHVLGRDQATAFSRYMRALAAATTGGAAGAAGRSPQHLLFNHMHLTNNRLGIAPHAEAVLAEVLRLAPHVLTTAQQTGPPAREPGKTPAKKDW